MKLDKCAALDDVFDKLIFAKFNGSMKRFRTDLFNLSLFDNLSLSLHPDFMDLGEDLRVFTDLDGSGFVDFDPEVLWPFSQQLVYEDKNLPGALVMMRYDVINAAQARRYQVNRLSPKMLIRRVAVLRDSLIENRQVDIASYLGGKWVAASHRANIAQSSTGAINSITGDEDKVSRCDFSNSCALAQSLALTERYEWSVAIGFTDGPKVRLHSDASGLRAMFRDRDKPDVGNRRPALRHWVREHWRQRRVDPEADIFVRHHFRGRTDFSWYGYDCTIRPSEFDLDRAAIAKAEGRS